MLRTVVHGKRRELGIGGASLVSLAEARDKARTLRKVARDGGDPDALRQREGLTFRQAAEKVHAQLLPTWRNAKHAETWLQTVRTPSPSSGTSPSKVTTANVLAVLAPIWTDAHETANRLKQRLATIFDRAKGVGHHSHENPVNGLKKALPVVKRRAVHTASLPWQDVPELMSEVAGRKGLSARTLEFVILTAARSGDARGARWSEFDFKAASLPCSSTGATSCLRPASATRMAGRDRSPTWCSRVCSGA